MQVQDAVSSEVTGARRIAQVPREAAQGAFFWLSAFYVVYCARPEDWIPGLSHIPLAKISGAFALVGLMMSSGRTRRGLRDLPREAKYLFAMICLLFVSAVFSPVWRGGAFFKTLDFSKALIAWVLTFLVITTFSRLRKIIFIQSISVVVISVVSVLKGRSHPRLEGAIGGIYSNPNDLAFAIVLTLPFCFAFLLSSRSMVRKLAWALAMLGMCTTLFMTASRAGFIDLVITGVVSLWIFGIKGRRMHLIAAAVLVALLIGFTAGGRLKDRFVAMTGNVSSGLEEGAYDSYLQRRFLMVKSLQAIERYPLGIGLGDFEVYSGVWREVHMSYLQIAAEGGVATFVLYLLFFGRGFGNLKRLKELPVHDPQIDLFAGALFSTLVGFLVGACFAPEAYQFFPYFAVAYTSVLYAIAKDRQPEVQAEAPPASPGSRGWQRAGALAKVNNTAGGLSNVPSVSLRNRH